MENFDRLVTDRRITKQGIADFLSTSRNPFDLFANEFCVIHTSGSSGEIGFFVYSRDDWARGMAHALDLYEVGLRKRRLVFFGATKGHFAGITFVSTAQRSIGKWFFKVRTYDINHLIAPTIGGLNAFQPDILIGYPSGLTILAEKQREGTLHISPSIVESSGEPVHSVDRSIIEAAFHVPLLDVYMSSEHIYMGISTPGHRGMYLLEDDLIFELHADHTCVTNLFNYTMPLIRYRMEDVLIPTPDEEKILPFIKVKEIIGRNEYAPVFTNKHGVGDFLSPHIINEFIVAHLRRFQIKLVSKTSFLFRACLEEGLDETQRTEVLKEIRKRMRSILLEKDMDNVSFEIQTVSDLPVDDNTGKFKLILPPDDM